MTAFQPGDRVRFKGDDPDQLTGTVRTWEEKFRRQWKKEREYFDQWPWCQFWNNIINFRRHVEGAREKDQLNLGTSVHWDGQPEFGCDGYDTDKLEKIA